jgi:hypothetical protein
MCRIPNLRVTALLGLTTLACSPDAPDSPLAAEPGNSVGAKATWFLYSSAPAPPPNDLRAIASGTRGELYIVGSSGYMMIENNDSQGRPQQRTVQTGTDMDFHDVILIRDSSVMAVGPKGVFVWNGISGMVMPGSPTTLLALAGGGNNIYAVGGSHVWHWNGATWSIIFTAPGGDVLRDISGGSSRLYAVSAGGRAYHFNGVQWDTQEVGIGPLNVVWLDRNSSYGALAFNAGGGTARFDGERWRTTGNLPFPVAHIQGDYINNLWAVGRNGWIAHYNGWVWRTRRHGTRHLYAIATARGDLNAVGEKGIRYRTVLNGCGDPWQLHPSNMDFRAGMGSTFIDGRDRYDGTLVAGPEGHIYRGHFATWCRESSEHLPALNDMWAAAPDDIYAVGDRGVVLHYDGRAWSKVRSGGPALRAVWGHDGTVWAVGDSGVSLRYDGAGWTSIPTGVTVSLQGVHGTGADRVFAVGGGRVLHYDGSAWTGMTPPPCGCQLFAVYAKPSVGIVVAGSGGSVYLRAPGGWQRMNVPGAGILRDIWAAAWYDMFVVGDDGVLAHWNGNTWTSQYNLPSPKPDLLKIFLSHDQHRITVLGSRSTLLQSSR